MKLSLKQKHLILNGFCTLVSLGAIGLLYSVCTGGFTDLVGISAKNLSALYTTGEIRASLWKEMANLNAFSQGNGSAESVAKSVESVAKSAEGFQASSTGELHDSIREFIALHEKLSEKIERRLARPAGATNDVKELEAIDALYHQASETLNEFSESILVRSQEQQGETIRATTVVMKIAFFTAIALTLTVLLVSFLYLKRSIITPVLKISAASLRAAGGDLKPIEDLHQKDDELGVLVRNFNAMIQEILSSADAIRAERDIAENANRAKSMFLANMSHELRTPMHGILSFAKFGQQKSGTAAPEKLKSYFDEIHDSGSRLMSLLNDILDLSKLEAGRIDYSFQDDDLSETLETVMTEMRAFAEEKQLRIERTDAGPVFARFDSFRIMQVVRNILSNAIKFSDPSTVIRIEVERSRPETWTCRIVNRGIGIPESELETIFDKFIQSSKTKSGAGGTGLGLAICREIIRQHGGEIRAESEHQGETHFIFELPATPAASLKKAA